MSFALQFEQDSSYKKPQKLFFALLGILFLIAPFYYQANLGGEGLFLPHNSAIWIVATWIISTACFIIYRTNEIILPRYWLGLALMPIGAWVTGLVADNNNPTEWLVRLSVITGGYLFFLSLFQFRLSKAQTLSSLLIIVLMGLIASAYGLLQIFDLAKHLSFVPYSPSQSPVSIFQQINIQASVMATVLAISFYLASKLAANRINFLVIAALIMCTVVSSYTIALSGSRVGLLAVLLSLALILVGRFNLLLARKALFIALIIATSIGGYLGQDGLSSTTGKIERTVTNIGGMDGDIRWNIYGQSWELFKESPIVGHGLGSFQKVFQERRGFVQSEGITSFKHAPRFSHPHNELIFWLVEGGTIAIIGILVASIVTLIQLVKSGWRTGFALSGLLIPIVLHTQVELPFYISNTTWLLLLFLLFICHSQGTKIISTDKLSNSAKITIPLVFFIVSLVTSFSMVNAQVANAGIVKYLQLKQSYPENLIPALNNTYFREYGTYLALRRQLLLGMRSNDKEAARTFVKWAEVSLETIPAPQTYRDLVIAYQFLGDETNAKRTLQHALSIYSEHIELLKLKDKINKDSAQSPNKDSYSKGRDRDAIKNALH